MAKKEAEAAQIPMEVWTEEQMDAAMEAHFQVTTALMKMEEDYKVVQGTWRNDLKELRKEVRDRHDDIQEQKAARGGAR